MDLDTKAHTDVSGRHNTDMVTGSSTPVFELRLSFVKGGRGQPFTKENEDFLDAIGTVLTDAAYVAADAYGGMDLVGSTNYEWIDPDEEGKAEA